MASFRKQLSITFPSFLLSAFCTVPECDSVLEKPEGQIIELPDSPLPWACVSLLALRFS